MDIQPGDIFWPLPDAADERILHPQIVIQTDVSTPDGLPAVVVCALTTNLKRVSIPGNLLLDAGEANLPKASVVEVSKTTTFALSRLGAYVGRLDARRISQLQAGIRFVQTSYPRDEA